MRAKLPKLAAGWAEPFAHALAAADREAAPGDYLVRFERRITPFSPFGRARWDESRVERDADGVPLHGNASHDFAFEVALAVCAWDLDDTALRDHPYYPRDLVDRYRTHLRQDRDGRRATGAGSSTRWKTRGS